MYSYLGVWIKHVPHHQFSYLDEFPRNKTRDNSPIATIKFDACCQEVGGSRYLRNNLTQSDCNQSARKTFGIAKLNVGCGIGDTEEEGTGAHLEIAVIIGFSREVNLFFIYLNIPKLFY